MKKVKEPVIRFTIKDFNTKYPDDDTCLEEIFQNRYGHLKTCPNSSCNKDTNFYKISGRKCYKCQHCGYELWPLANTIFHKSDTPLTKWFYAIYLFSSSRNGVAAKELERQLGVTYKTAWRMAGQIRKLFKNVPPQLKDNVELDETYMGGKESNKHLSKRAKGTQGRSLKIKTPVIGMIERKGQIVAKVISNNHSSVIHPLVRWHIKKGSTLLTDEWGGYNNLQKYGFKHKRVNHEAKQYVKGIAHTNTIEGFWGQLKRSINGTYHAVSPKYLQAYVDEFSFRYGKRYSPQPLFYPILSRAGKPFVSDF